MTIEVVSPEPQQLIVTQTQGIEVEAVLRPANVNISSVGTQGPSGASGIGNDGVRGSRWFIPDASNGYWYAGIVSPVAQDKFVTGDGSVHSFDGTVWSNTGISLRGPAGNTGPAGPSKNTNVTLTSLSEFLIYTNILNDGSDTATWPDRMRFYLAGVPVSWFNEFGEFRAIPAKSSTIPFRIFVKNNPTDAAHNTGVPVMEVVDNRTDRVRKFAVHNDGTVEAPNVLNKVVTVPTGTTGFASQPDGTLWIEYTP